MVKFPRRKVVTGTVCYTQYYFITPTLITCFSYLLIILKVLRKHSHSERFSSLPICDIFVKQVNDCKYILFKLIRGENGQSFNYQEFNMWSLVLFFVHCIILSFQFLQPDFVIFSSF